MRGLRHPKPPSWFEAAPPLRCGCAPHHEGYRWGPLRLLLPELLSERAQKPVAHISALILRCATSQPSS